MRQIVKEWNIEKGANIFCMKLIAYQTKDENNNT